jgi:predicted ester cyclase
VIYMQTERNKELVRRWLAFAEAGFDGPFDAFIAVDYVGHLSGGDDMDRAGLERLERAFASAFVDARYLIQDIVAEGDKVVLRVETRATHRGEFHGVAATGRRVELTGIVIYRVRDGKIVETWAEMDFGRLLRQLGEGR